MPAPYTELVANDSTNMYTLFGYVNNTATGGLFMPITLLVIWIVSFVGAISEGRQASRAFIFSSFVLGILSILCSLIGFLNPQFMYFSFLMVGIGLIWYKLDNAVGL